MPNWREFFRGKKITVMGLGLLGRGVGDVKFLAECGAVLVVTDLKSATTLGPSLNKLRQYKNIKFVLGEHRLEDFRNRDLVIKAAGVPLDSPYIAEARKHGIPVEMSTALFVKLAPTKNIIGVTGTRGKSTTTQLIYEILKLGLSRSQKGTAGRTTLHGRVVLGGNVRGVSTLALLSKVRPGDIVVLELDSWQLQGFGPTSPGLRGASEAGISPHIAVFTNFLDDHLNYYRGDKKRYWEDKTNIFKYQKAGDVLICGAAVAKRLRREPPASLPDSWRLKIVGEHNRPNAALAKKVGETLGIKPAVIKKVITGFSGVPGRLELVKTFRGVKFYNDTTATTPDAVTAALRALGSPRRRNIILVAGGADKNLDLTPLLKEIPKYYKALILLPGSGSEKLKAQSQKLKVKIKNLKEARNLGQAVKKAIILARRGDIVLFSPGFASFGLFKNEFDRGEKFVGLVEKLFKDVQFPRPGL